MILYLLRTINTDQITENPSFQASITMAPRTLQLFVLVSVISFLQINLCFARTSVRAAYWFPASEFPVSNIDSTQFTHLFCAFANLDPQSKQVTISSSDAAAFSQFTKTVQAKNPNVKTLLSIGGGNSNSRDFAAMASQSASRKAFIDSSIRLARSNGFQGLDLDWEYPLAASDMTNLGVLLDEWRAAVNNEAGSGRLLLAAAVSYKPVVDGLRYPVGSISRNLDWINVMAYDLFAPNRADAKVTKPHAALYDPSSARISARDGIEDWIRARVPEKKLVLGFPFYGYAWRLVDANNHGLGAPANGPLFSPDGSIGYNRIKEFIAQNRARTVHNSTVGTDYCYSGTTWIGYDDTQTIAAKVSFAKQKGLLGYFAWHVGADSNWALSKQAKAAWGA